MAIAATNVLTHHLHLEVEVFLLDIPQTLLKLGRGAPLRTPQLPRRVLQILLQLQVIFHLLSLLVSQFVGHLRVPAFFERIRPRIRISIVALPKLILHLLLKLALSLRQFFGTLGQIAQLLFATAALGIAHQIPGFIQPLGRTPGLSIALLPILLIGRRPTHVVGGFLQLLHGLVNLRVAIQFALLPTLLPTLLTLLPLLSTLLPLARRILLLILLQLLQFLLQLLSLTTQHLLLPSLLRRLLILLSRIGQFLLPPGQLLQLPHRLIHFSLLLFRAHLLAGLVLVLFRIQFQIEQALHVTLCSTAAATALLTHRDFNLFAPGLSPLQILQRLLLMRQRVLELQPAQSLNGRRHRLRRLSHILRHRFDRLVLASQLPRPDPLHKSLCLLPQFLLRLAQKLGVFLLLSRRLFALLFLESGTDNFLLPLDNIAALLPLTATAPALLLTLGKLALIRLCFKEKHIGRRFRLGIARLGIEHNVVSG